MADVDPGAFAWLGGRLATGCVEVTDDPAALDGSGFWAVVATFEGDLTFARFADVRPAPLPDPADAWPRLAGEWRTPMDRAAYVAACREVRERIAGGHRLPGQRLPGARARPAGRTPTSLALAAAARRGQPGAVRRGRAGPDAATSTS